MFWSMVEQFKVTGSVTKLCSLYSFAAVKLDQMLPNRWQAGAAMADLVDLCIHLDLEDIRSRKAEWQETVRIRQIMQRIPPPDKECRQLAAKIMKSLLKPYGYRSLAEFERAWKKDGQKMPWPKAPDASVGRRHGDR